MMTDQQPAGKPPRATLLPGMAMIAIYVLIVSLFRAFAAARGPSSGERYVVLTASTLMVVGAFGLLGLRRWGWALISAGCLYLAAWSVYVSRQLHTPAPLVMAALNFVLFLYLARPEVRERLR